MRISRIPLYGRQGFAGSGVMVAFMVEMVHTDQPHSIVGMRDFI